MAQNVIAILFDCDGTLCPDTTDLLLDELHLSRRKFWNVVSKMVERGWDPPLAYTSLLCSLNRERNLNLTKKVLEIVGSKIRFFQGVPQVFSELKKFVEAIPQFREAGIILEYHVITGGVEDIIRASRLKDFVDSIFGCRFITNNRGEIEAPMSVISFTEKTRYVFAINKGLSESEMRRSPYSVNDAIPDEDRRVPFENMIYVGDGPSDIPCFSLIAKFRGWCIGVYRAGTSDKGYELAAGKRTGLGPYKADYRPRTDLREAMENCIRDIGFRVVTQGKMKTRKAPAF